MTLFNDSHIIPLLEECRRHPCLWAVGTNDHKDPILREAALLDITKNLGVPNLTTRALMYKITNLKRKYLRAWDREQKIKNRKKKGVPLQPKHFWYRVADSFWRPEPVLPVTKTTKGKELKVYKRTPRAEKDDAQTSEDESRKPKTFKLSTLSRKPIQDDEFDIFGRSVAVQLRQMPLSNALKLQAELQSLITKHRVGLVDEGRSVQPSSSSDYQPAERPAITSEVHLKFEPRVKCEPSE